MAAKCNISKYALLKGIDLLYNMKSCNGTVDRAIAENYLEYIGCATMHTNCYEEPCTNSVEYFECNLVIGSIDIVVDGNTVTATAVKDGGTAPFSYQWDLPFADFNLISMNGGTVVMQVKDWKDIENLVSNFMVTITDANGCTQTKSCWLDHGEQNCSSAFVPCLPPVFLTIEDSETFCVSPQNLIVN